MKTEDTLIELKEAALFLKTSESVLRALADRGGIPCIRTAGKKGDIYQFRLADLVSRRKKRLTPETLNDALAKADDARARVARLEGLVSNLISVLGLQEVRLGTAPTDIQALHLEVETLLREYTIELSAAELHLWASRFLAVTEEYLQRYCAVLNEPFAWRPLLELATRIEVEAAPRPSDGPRREAHSFVQAGRRSLRATCFFYVEKAHGKTTAAKLIKRGEDLNSIVLRFLRMS